MNALRLKCPQTGYLVPRPGGLGGKQPRSRPGLRIMFRNRIRTSDEDLGSSFDRNVGVQGSAVPHGSSEPLHPRVGGTPAPGPDLQGFEVPVGVAALVLLNISLFLAATVWKSSAVATLAINPVSVTWWSFLTSAFVHHNLEQLGRNMFVVFFFSRLVNKDLGAVGVWFAYILGAVGANFSSWAFLAGTAKVKALSMLGVASSGGAMAVFLTALVLSFRPSLTWVLGAALSGNFIMGFLLGAPASAAAAAASAAAASAPSASSSLSAALSGDPVSLVTSVLKSLKATAASPGNTWAVGAAGAAALVVLMARLPDPDAPK